MHVFKRIYLLSVIILALTIPLITFTEYVDPVYITEQMESIVLSPTINPDIKASQPTNYLPLILGVLYAFGVFIFGIKFIRNLTLIIIKIRQNQKQKEGQFTNVLLNNESTPHTFFNFIFLNKNNFENHLIPTEVILHEQTHAKQKHSIDILFIEFTQVVLWFHPLIYLIKKQIKLNHEFLADQAVINQGISKTNYQNLVLAFSSNAANTPFANAFNYSSIKKRFTVMNTHTSTQKIWLRSLILLPIIGMSLYGFSQKKEVVKTNTSNITVHDLEDSDNSATENMMKEYNNFIIEYKTTNRINVTKQKRAVAIYNLMTPDQKSSVEKYQSIPEIDLSKTEAKKPTVKEFKSWKNNKKFALWLDGVHVPNHQLNSYSVDDIAYFTGSFVHENARNSKFPQPFQYRLYTKKGFKDTYQNSKINDYKALYQTYSNDINTFLNSDRSNNSELRIKKAQIDEVYKTFTSIEISAHNILKAASVPSEKQNKTDSENEWEKVESILTQNSQQTSLDFVISLAKQDAKFFYAGKEISSGKAIALIKENEDLSINVQKNKMKQMLVYITETPIIIPNNGKSDDDIFINGIKIGATKEITLSKTALSNCKITTKKGAITQFTMKIAGIPTQTINGNTPTEKIKKILEASKSGELIQFFNIKDSEYFTIDYVLITLE